MFGHATLARARSVHMGCLFGTLPTSSNFQLPHTSICFQLLCLRNLNFCQYCTSPNFQNYSKFKLLQTVKSSPMSDFYRLPTSCNFQLPSPNFTPSPHFLPSFSLSPPPNFFPSLNLCHRPTSSNFQLLPSPNFFLIPTYSIVKLPQISNFF